jgi:HPt (histidine-containing phosphotransfer) domain-containing protein
VRIIDQTTVLDRQQLRDITMDDNELMEEVLSSLLDDTSKQIVLLDSAIRERNPKETMRLAHYCKGACANLGANAVAAVLKRLEQEASHNAFEECTASLANLTHELERLRVEAAAV